MIPTSAILDAAIDSFEIEEFEAKKKEFLMGGIYVFYNKTNSRIYIGGTCNLRSRFNNYSKAIKGQEKFHSRILARLFAKYSINNFKFLILEKFEKSLSRNKEFVLSRENYYLQFWQPFGDRGYNTHIIAESCLGIKRSEQDKIHQRVIQRQIRSNAKLNRNDIQEIFRQYSEGSSITHISKNFHVIRATISSILRRKNWVDIPIDAQIEAKVAAKLKCRLPDDVAMNYGRKLLEYSGSRETISKIALELGICESLLTAINSGKLYPFVKKSLSPDDKYIHRPPSRKPHDFDSDILNLLINTQLPFEKIAAHLNTYPANVSRVATENNVRRLNVVTGDLALKIGNYLLSRTIPTMVAKQLNVSIKKVNAINLGLLFPLVKKTLAPLARSIFCQSEIIPFSKLKKLVQYFKEGSPNIAKISKELSIPASFSYRWYKRFKEKSLHFRGRL